MRAVLQRVASARVEAEGVCLGEIGRGLVALVAVEKGDTAAEADWTAGKIAELRAFPDENDRMNLSVRQTGCAVLMIPQFTLAADLTKGRRPDFTNAAAPEDAVPLLERVRRGIEATGVRVEEGRFGARMSVWLVNDGPVTFILERRPDGSRGR